MPQNMRLLANRLLARLKAAAALRKNITVRMQALPATQTVGKHGALVSHNARALNPDRNKSGGY